MPQKPHEVSSLSEPILWFKIKKKKSQKLCTQVQITEEGANRTVRFKVYTWVEIFKEQQHDLAPVVISDSKQDMTGIKHRPS